MIYWFDILLIVITLILAVRGVLNGLVKEFFGLLGIVGGVLIASRLAASVGKLINSRLYDFKNPDIEQFVGFLLVLVAFWLICLFFGYIFNRIINMSDLAIINKIGGFILGFVKIFLIFAILLFCLNKFEFFKAKIAKFAPQSYVVPILQESGAFIMNEPLVKEALQEVKENLENPNPNLPEFPEIPKLPEFEFETNQTQGE